VLHGNEVAQVEVENACQVEHAAQVSVEGAGGGSSGSGGGGAGSSGDGEEDDGEEEEGATQGGGQQQVTYRLVEF
jgi:hypothetical protein